MAIASASFLILSFPNPGGMAVPSHALARFPTPFFPIGRG